jgi:site-specific recombinase XerD
VNRDYLTMEEIKALQQLEGLNEAVERNRDLFLFACYTGLSYSDIATLKSIHVVEEADGSCSIMKARQKSKQLSFVPLLPAAEKILKKYSPTGKCSDFQWKVVSNQKLNQSLKEIAKRAGIEKKLFMHLGRHTFATTVTLSNGVPIETVGKMLGHSTLKHTQIYAKVVVSKVKNEMMALKKLF